MASTETPQLGPFDAADMAGCLALSAEAGWNQTTDDWSLFMRHGRVLGLRDKSGRPIASGAVLPYPDRVAWISMVLVTAGQRRRRIGTTILERCCSDIASCGLVAVLDATPAGELVYRPLGFEPMFTLSRWQGSGGGSRLQRSGIRAMTLSDMAAVAELDAAAFGAPRVFLLENFLARAPQLAFVTADVNAFVLVRPGRIATQVGPLVASDEETAIALLEIALARIVGPVFLDVADCWRGLALFLRRQNFAVQRPYLRMGLGRGTPFGEPRRNFVIAGPEFG